MSILVNPFTEKFAGKFAKTTLGKFVQRGKRLYKSIFGMPESLEKQLAHNPYKPKTSIFNIKSFSNNPQGETVEQFCARLSKKHGHKATDVRHGITAYVPQASLRKIPQGVRELAGQPIEIIHTSRAQMVKSLKHEPPVHSDNIRKVKEAGKFFERQVNAGKIQPKRTQAYYDALGTEIESAKAVKGETSFYNSRTGKTTTLYGNSNVIVSKGKVDLVELDNAPQGFRRITRTASDGIDYLHGRNSIEDVWDPRRGWTGQSGHTGPGIPLFREEPAVRTPVIPE